jgi:hypothetical protein
MEVIDDFRTPTADLEELGIELIKQSVFSHRQYSSQANLSEQFEMGTALKILSAVHD